ncbi:MAG: peptidoglycan DD-metalloendopeptidase family protein [Gammaproteobacteria bacterium]|nr:peptidoglycan DD-metalloendopeptidase family protein [Gammaproteobacteria bacterium]
MQQGTKLVQLTVFLLMAVVLQAGCSSSRFVAYGDGRYSNANNNKVHVVQKGETLYSIAWQYGQDYRQLADWNDIPVPYTIFPEQKIKLDLQQKKITVAGAQIPARSKKIKTVKDRTNNKNPVAPDAEPQQSHKNTKIQWFWPTKGTIISRYSASDPGKKGLDIAGKSGQAINAAASGVVVYSGNGLRGYGNLIIIKHDDTYFSAYAHNQKILVKEAEKVKFGQRIADMGSTDTDKPMLHFEIRRNGKPSNPMNYLPRDRS